MTNHEMMQIIDGIRKFPIGEIAADRETLLSKAEIVAYLAPFQEQFTISSSIEVEESVKEFLGRVISLKEGEKIPTVAEAERFLRLSPGFLQDFGRVQYIKERHPEFSQVYDFIIAQMKRENQKSEAKQL